MPPYSLGWLITSLSRIQAHGSKLPSASGFWHWWRSLETAQRAEINRLHDVAREKQFHNPIHHYARLSFQAGQLGQVNRAPHGPCNQAREPHRFVSGEWYD